MACSAAVSEGGLTRRVGEDGVFTLPASYGDKAVHPSSLGADVQPVLFVRLRGLTLEHGAVSGAGRLERALLADVDGAATAARRSSRPSTRSSSG